MDCLDDNDVVDLMDGGASGARRASFDRHIDSCVRCRALVAAAVGLRSVPPPSGLSTETHPTADDEEAAPPTERRAEAEGDAPITERREMIDHFQIIRLLNRGGMGEVYLARDTKLGRRVALKVIRRERLGDRQAIRMFVHEARTTAAFNHPHIVTVHAVGEVAGQPYVALEYLEGQNLRERMAERRLAIREVLRIGAAVARALREAHRHNILHRDLKPENVVIPRDGRPRVVDFGLAEQLAPAPLLETMHTTARDPDDPLRGTPAYLAPELWLGAHPTPAADVWALGVMLYELCAGRRPFEGSDDDDLVTAVVSPSPSPRLADECEIDPALADLVDRCLIKDPDKRPNAAHVAEVMAALLDPASPQATDRKGPFPGLRPFTESDAALYFGREAEIASFCERLRTEPTLAIVGGSGSGKSSFVQAGVVPRLRDEGRWTLLALRPGAAPFAALAARLLHGDADGDATTLRIDQRASGSRPDRIAAMAAELAESPQRLGLELRNLVQRSGSRVLLFVDQLEELYTLSSDDEIHRRFMEAIATAADDPFEPARVVLTARDDFLGRIVTTAEARRAFSHVTVLERPTPGALAEMVRGPVHAVGYEFDDPELVEEMVREVSGEPACLPLLQFCAQVLWDRRDRERQTLLRSSYHAVGGVGGVLARHADGVLEALAPADRLVARSILLRLVTPERTRRRISRTEALRALAPSAADVLRRLTRARLLSMSGGDDDDSLVELAHESLIERWATLRRWLDEPKDEHAIVAELSQAAELWHRRGRQDGELWEGEALVECARVVERAGDALPPLVREFVHAARERERGRARRRRLALTALVTLLATALIGAVLVALHIADKEKEARAQRSLAEAQRAIALREGARAAFGHGRMLEARAKLRMALEAEDSTAARVLFWQLASDPLLWSHKLDMSYAAAFAPDGSRVATAQQSGSVGIFDAATGELRMFRGHGDHVRDVAFARDGRVVSVGLDGRVLWWDGSSGKVLSELDTGTDVKCVALSPDGRQLATGHTDHRIRLWREDGTKAAVLEGHTGGILDLSYSPDGRWLGSIAMPDGSVRVWRVGSGRLEAELPMHRQGGFGLSFSPDGRRLAAVSRAGVYLWQSGGWRAEPSLDEAREATALTFVRKGEELVVGTAEGEVLFFDMARRSLENRLIAGHTHVIGLAVSPDGRSLASTTVGGDVKLWRIDGPKSGARVGPHVGSVYGVAFDAGSRHVVTSGKDTTVRLWDAETGEPVALMKGAHTAVAEAWFDPQGTRIVSAAHDGTARIYRLGASAPEKEITHGNSLMSARFSPDGAWLATAGADRLRLWNADEGVQLRAMPAGAALLSLDFSRDGSLVTAGSADGRLHVWSTATGAPLAEIDGHAARVRSARFHPNGQLVASSGDDGKVLLHDLTLRTKRALPARDGRPYLSDFSPDGRRLVVPYSSGLTRIWNLEDDTDLVLRGHRAEANAAVFAANGRWVASVGDDATLRLWDADRGRPLWRAPLLLEDALLSHRGLLALGGQEPVPWPHGNRSRAMLDDASYAVMDGARLCALRHDGRVESWDLERDARVAAREAPGRDTAVQALVAFAGDCLALAAGRVWPTGAGNEPLAPATVTAMDVSRDRVVFGLANGNALVLDESLREIERRTVGGAAAAIALVPDGIAVGYRDGSVEVRGAGDEPRLLQLTPPSPATRIVAGARDTLAVGFENGVVGLWDRRDGARLASGQLHGPIAHLRFSDARAVFASELGDSLVWELSALAADRCALLADVWETIGVVWEQGRAVTRPPPDDHSCRR